MQLQTKALYNLLRFNYQEDPSIACESWQVEDLRLSSVEDLFARIQELGLPLDKDQFFAFGESVESPEELTEILLDDHREIQTHDQIYLLLFELWRRLFPNKQTLSIFCDELDYRIHLYDRGELESDENIQDALANLEEILDENADVGAEPIEVFQTLSQYCAHDLEGFLYDYISEQIDAGYEFYASELLEGFYPYMSELRWFDFLRARLLASSDVLGANRTIALLVKELHQNPDLDLQLEILRFMVQAGDRSLFMDLLQNTLTLLQTEEDFQDIMEIAADYYRRLDIEEMEAAVQRIMQRRLGKKPMQELSQEDPDLKDFLGLILPS